MTRANFITTRKSAIAISTGTKMKPWVDDGIIKKYFLK